MTRIKKIVAALTVAVFAAGVPAADASVVAKAQKSKSASNPTVMQKVGSATSGFFKGVVDTVTLKKFTSKSSSKK